MLDGAWELILHLDRHVAEVVQSFGLWSYALLFGLVFAETGLVVATALPSDTLLFASGALAARGTLHVWTLFIGFFLAATAGDSLNYAIGRFLGRRFFHDGRVRVIKTEHIEAVHRYYERHGAMTIVAARFVPILRSLAPLVGGVVGLETGPFLRANLLGKLLWTPLYLFGGYYLGQLPWMRDNFALTMAVAMGVPFVAAGARAVWVFTRSEGRP